MLSKRYRWILIVAAFGLLAAVDYLAAKWIANSLGKQERAVLELQRLREQDAALMKRHVQICLLTEDISRMCYDSGVAMGGYSITKSPQFSKRFDSIADAVSKKLQELEQLVSASPEGTTAHEIAKQAEQIIAINRQSKELIDDPKVDVAQFRARHVYKEVRNIADQLHASVKKMRDEDLVLVNRSLNTQIEQTIDSKSEGALLPVFLLAFLNAICGCLIARFLRR